MIELTGGAAPGPPNTLLIARVSIESFSLVPVPCAAIQSTPAGSSPAMSSACRIAAAAPRPSGWMSVMRYASAVAP